MSHILIRPPFMCFCLFHRNHNHAHALTHKRRRPIQIDILLHRRIKAIQLNSTTVNDKKTYTYSDTHTRTCSLHTQKARPILCVTKKKQKESKI